MVTIPQTDFEQLFYNMSIPRFLIKPDDGHYILSDINKIALKYFDLEKDNILGGDVSLFMNHENAAHFKQSFEVSHDTKSSVTIQTLPGFPGPVRVHSFYISPIFDDYGDVSLLDVVGQLDMSDHSALQRERDDAVILMSSIFEVSEVAIIVTDHNSNIVRVNESFVKTYGWPRDALLGSNLTDFITPDDRIRALKDHEQVIKSGAHKSGEIKIIRKNGNVANVLLRRRVWN